MTPPNDRPSGERVAATERAGEGWTWIEPEWHPNDDPIWKSYRMAGHADGRLANFERRATVDISDRGVDQ